MGQNQEVSWSQNVQLLEPASFPEASSCEYAEKAIGDLWQ